MESSALAAELLDLVLKRKQRARIRITGKSMEPLLRAGMVVDVEPMGARPRLGDILIFRSGRGLIAHRLVGGETLRFQAAGRIVADPRVNDRTATFVTCGDKFPERPETVPRKLVVGRVTAVWSGAEAGAHRVDGRLFRYRGIVLARTRILRSLRSKLLAYGAIISANPARVAPPQAFLALVAATAHFEKRRYGLGVESLSSVPATTLIDVVRRHHMSGIVTRWLDDAKRAGISVPEPIHEPLRRIRLASALQANLIVECAREVGELFTAAAIPHVFLKGAARLAADLADANLQYAGDVDVLVPKTLAERAMEVLRGAGHQETRPKYRQREFASMHHREPLKSPRTGIPVEVHSILIRADAVDQELDYSALQCHVRSVNGPIGEASVLDDVGAAVHLAYHARDLSVLRDIVLLARLMVRFDVRSRAQFEAFVGRERRDRLRLTSAVALADWINETEPVRGPSRRYLSWAIFREDLPANIEHDIPEALLGRCAALKLRYHLGDHRLFNSFRTYLRNIVALPLIGRIALWRRKTSGVPLF